MSVRPEDVHAVARLARLRLAESDLDRMTRDMNAILAHVDELASLDLDERGTAVSEEIPPVGRGMREAEETPEREGTVVPRELAPEARDGFFVVPPPPGVHDTESDS